MKRKKHQRGSKRREEDRRGPFLTPHPLSGLSLPDRKAYAVELGEKSRKRKGAILEEVRELCARIEPFITLAVLQTYALMNGAHSSKAPREVKLQQGHIEFVQALLLTCPPRQGIAPPQPDDIQRLFDLLPELFEAHQTARLPTASEAPSAASEKQLAMTALQEYLRAHTAVVRNWGYYGTVKRVSHDQFRAVDSDFHAKFGLALTDVVRLFDHLIRRMEDRVNQHCSQLRSVFSARTMDELVESFLEAFPFKGELHAWSESFKREAPHLEGAKNGLLPLADRFLTMRFFINSAVVAEALQIDAEATDSLMTKLSHSLGSTQDCDVESFFWNNPVWTKPLIKLSGHEYFCALPQTGMSFIYQIADALLQEAPELTEKFSKARSDYLEREVHRLLAAAFPNAQFATAYKWRHEGQQFEADLILRYDTTLLLVEAKSGKVTWPALRGATDRVVEHVKRLIVDPSEQSGRLSKVIQQEIEVRKSETKETLDFPISLDGITSVLRLSVTLHDFATVQSVPTLLKDAGLLSNQYPLSPCISLADLEVMLDLLEHPHERLHYIRQRAQSLLTHHLVGDELDIMGFYLDTGLNLNGFEPGKHRLITAGYSAAIDKYYSMRDEGQQTPKPSRSLSPWFKSLLSQVANRPTQGWSELTSALLSVTRDDQDELERRVRAIAACIKAGRTPPNEQDAIILSGPAWTNSALVIHVKPRLVGQRANAKAENLASATFEQEHIERCHLIVVDALDPELAYTGGSVWYRTDRPVPATIFM